MNGGEGRTTRADAGPGERHPGRDVRNREGIGGGVRSAPEPSDGAPTNGPLSPELAAIRDRRRAELESSQGPSAVRRTAIDLAISLQWSLGDVNTLTIPDIEYIGESLKRRERMARRRGTRR